MKIIFTWFLLFLCFVRCGSDKGTDKKIVINSKALSGTYYSNEHFGDSIFVYENGTYLYKYYSMKNGTVDSVRSTWEYKRNVNSIIFSDFRFYSDAGASDHSGVWPPEVLLSNDGKISFKYSDDVFYVKKDE